MKHFNIMFYIHFNLSRNIGIDNLKNTYYMGLYNNLEPCIFAVYFLTIVR